MSARENALFRIRREQAAAEMTGHAEVAHELGEILTREVARETCPICGAQKHTWHEVCATCRSST